jgi:hypothetical protein
MAFRQKEGSRTVEYLEPSDLMRGLLERPATLTIPANDLDNLLHRPIPDRVINPVTEKKKVKAYRCSCAGDNPSFFYMFRSGCYPKEYELEEGDPRIKTE